MLDNFPTRKDEIIINVIEKLFRKLAMPGLLVNVCPAIRFSEIRIEIVSMKCRLFVYKFMEVIHQKNFQSNREGSLCEIILKVFSLRHSIISS